MLNELQKDLLKEYVNVFVGKAASLLSEMANQRVLLHVPQIEILSSIEENSDSIDALKFCRFGHIISSSMRFGHEFTGRAMLIFPANKAKYLVDACLGESSEDAFSTELEDTDFDVLKEISNVLLNTVIGEFGNMLGVKLEFSLPDVESIFVDEAEQKLYLGNNMHIMMFYTAFTLSEANVEGMIVLALGLNSLNMLISRIDDVIGEM